MKFVIFEMWGLERPPNVPKWIPWKSWCTKVLSSVFALGQVGRCTTAQLDGLVTSFVKNWNSWFLRFEGWKDLQMSPNEYYESLGAQKFWVRWVLHMAKLSVHHDKARWLGGEFCEKMKFVIFEMWGLERPTNVPKRIPWKSRCTKCFEFGGFCTWPSWSVHHEKARWLGGEFCEKMKFVIFEMWGLERPTNVPKWIPWKCWCKKVLSLVCFAHGQGWRCTTA